MEAEPPDIVHAHFWMSGIASLVGARDLGLPVVQTFHALGTVKRRHQGTYDTSPPGRLRLEAALGRCVDGIVATCTDEVDELMRMGARREAVDVVPSGVDLGLFTDSGPSLPRTGLRRLVTIGRLVERKGVETVIEALAALEDTELLVAGGPENHRPRRRPARAAAARRGRPPRRHRPGDLPRPGLARGRPPLLRSADAVVTVPWYEPFGIVPLEAMACGRPVVASAVGGLTDTVTSGVTGEERAARRPDLLAVALERLLSDELRLMRYGRAAVVRARSRYGWSRIALETERVYQRLLERRAAALPMAVTP